MRISVSLLVLASVAMASASQSLLQALFDYNDPLLLDEHKSKRVAESFSKGKASKGSSKTNFFSQFNYDLGDDDDDDKYDKFENKDYLPDTDEEVEHVNQQTQHKGDDQYDNRDSSQHATSGQVSHKSDEQEQSNKDCPNDMPTYRMYSVLSGCGVPIDQDPVKAEVEEVGNQDQQQNLAHYVDQVSKDKLVGQHELLGSGVQEPTYYKQENTQQQGSQIYSQTGQLKADSDEVVQEPFVQTSGNDRLTGQHSVETTGQENEYMEEVYEEPFVQSSGNDRILGQEGTLLGQHSVETTGQHKDDKVEVEELPFVQSSGNDRILGQEGGQLGQTDYGQYGGYDQQSGQFGVQTGQIDQTSGQYEQNLGQSGRIEQTGQVGQVGQHGQVSVDGDDDYDDLGLSEQLWPDSDESKEYNQVSGPVVSQTGNQEQVYIPGQQQVGGPELPERVVQQTGGDGSYHLRSQSDNGEGTPRRAGGAGVWVGPQPPQQQGSRYNNYYVPISPPRPSHRPGSAGVGHSYNGGGPLVNIPNPNQIGIGGKFSCLGRSEGYYADYASDCRRFFRCAHGDTRVFEFQCGGGTKFDINTAQCAHAHEVHCSPTYM